MKTVSAVLISAIIILASLGTAYATSYTFTDLTYGSAPNTVATGINNAGTIVGYIGSPHGQSAPYQGFVLSGGVYTTLSFPDARNTLAYGISNSGAIVGRYQDMKDGWHGFVLDGGVYTGFNYPGAARTDAFGINRISNSGTIVGAYGDAGWSDSSPAGWHGYALSGATYTALDYPGATGTYLWDINNSGTIVGGVYNATGAHGLILSNVTWTTFNYPGVSGWTTGTGINDSGTIVGYASGGIGFTLSDGVYSPLNRPGARGTIAMDINTAGYVVGWYENAAGCATGFLATPIPEPCHVSEPFSILFLMSTLICLVGMKKEFGK
jgi:hypothetical protein